MSWLRYSVHSSADALDHSADGPVPITGLAAADALVHATTQDAGGIAVLTSGGLLRVLVLKAQSEVGGPYSFSLVPYNLGKHTHAHTHKMTALQGVLNGSWVDRAASEDRRGGTTMERYGRCRFKAP